MSDTSPAVERRYRALVLQRPGGERVRMACSMFATARALVIASIRAGGSAASGAALRRALFLRFYGRDFPRAEREQILARLERDERRRS
jgi:hypothetical protein